MDSDLPSRYSWDVLALAHKIPQPAPPPPPQIPRTRPAFRIPEADSGTPHLPIPARSWDLSAHRCYPPPQRPVLNPWAASQHLNLQDLTQPLNSRSAFGMLQFLPHSEHFLDTPKPDIRHPAQVPLTLEFSR
ncbi:unnamed protein product [Rangifer tarandus platyrhynchus]|uniref:Uncharacterized protein n=1 Tax=Rangifer tarandus platyrhynchus TaxID=3082113 RepID=A0AC59YTU5_RANTA